MSTTKTKRTRGGSKPKVIGGVPDPIIVSERVAVELFADVGVTRDLIRKLIDDGTILRRKLVVNNREYTGLLYQELLLLAQSLPIKPPNEY